MDFFFSLTYELFHSWVRLPFVERWAVATLVIASPTIYLFETVRYWRLFREKDTVHLAPISVRGKILEQLGPSGVALALRAELFSITEVLIRSIAGPEKTPWVHAA